MPSDKSSGKRRSKLFGVSFLACGVAAALAAPIGAQLAEVPETAEAQPERVDAAPADELVTLDLGRALSTYVEDKASEQRRSIEGSEGTILIERVFSLPPLELMDQLYNAASSGGSVKLELTETDSFVIDLDQAENFGIDDVGVAIGTVRKTGEIMMFRDFGETGIYGAFTDPAGRGRWVFATDSDGLLEVRLNELLIEHSANDVPNPSPSPQESTERNTLPDELQDYKFEQEPDLPSSVPTDEWILEDGSAFIESDQDGPRRNRVTTTLSFDVIDVAVFAGNGYQPNWLTISSRARRIIDDGNLAMMNSGLKTRFRLVGVDDGSPDFTGSNPIDVADAIDDMNGTGNNGVRAVVETLRFNFKPDVIVAVVNHSDLDGASGVAGGVPGPENPNIEYGLFVIEEDNVRNGYTAAHELGHILGGSHQDQSSGSNTSGAHSFPGPATTFRTIMWSSVSSSRIVQFSDPNVTFAGSVTGLNNRNNAAAVRLWDDDIGNFQQGYYCPSYGTNHVLFARYVFRDMIGKLPDSSTEASLLTRLTLGYSGSAGYTAWHASGAIATDSDASVGQELSRLFRTMFGRQPDYGGHTFWLGQRWNGTSLAAVSAAFAGSPEYFQLHGNRTDAQFVTFMYQNALGRNPDPGGLNAWVGIVQAHGRAQAAAWFANAGESVTHQQPTVEAVMLYHGLFNRAADTGGLNFWSGQIASGTSLTQASQVFMNAPDYWSQC